MTSKRWRSGGVGLVLVLTVGCGDAVTAPDPASLASDGSPAIVADRAVISVAPGADVAAVYLRLRNDGPAPERLLAASVPGASHTMLHETVREAGRLRMEPADEGLSLEPGQVLVLEPAGPHIMLMGVSGRYANGTRVPVALRLGSGGALEVEALVVAPGEVEAILEDRSP